MTGRAGSHRNTLVVAAVVLVCALSVPHGAAAQRGRGGGRPDISSLGSPTDFYVHPLFAGNPTYDGRLTFARIKYRGFAHYTNEGPGWAHDFPEADENLMKIMKEVTSAHPFIVEGKIRGGAIVALDDPLLFRYPVSYLSEPGGWFPNDNEVKGMRAYLLKGGFVIVDDFGGNDWPNFIAQMNKVLPGVRPVPLTGKEPIFDTFYKVDVTKVTSYRGRASFFALYENNDPKKRLLMIANYNADVGDGWQWAGQGFIPVDVTNEAFKLGVNYLVYGLTH